MDPNAALIQMINAINANLAAITAPTYPYPVVTAPAGAPTIAQLQQMQQQQLQMQQQLQQKLSPPSYSNTTVQQQQAPPPPKHRYSLGICGITKVQTIGVRRATGSYFLYEYDVVKNIFTTHQCTNCQAIVRESQLTPLYAEYDKELRKKVLFARNAMTMRVEQFVYSFPTNSFTQVNRPKLVYDQNKVVLHTNLIAAFKSEEGRGETVVFERTQQNGMRKLKIKGDAFEELGETALTMLPEPKKEECPNDASTDNLPDYDPSPMEKAYFDNLAKVSAVRVFTCPHSGTEYLHIFNAHQLRYYEFFYHEQHCHFVEQHCAFCTKTCTEGHMIPKYAQEYQGQQIIHVHNMYCGSMEQYIYDAESHGFEQVYYPELKYEPSKDSEGWVIYSGEFNGVPTVIMKDGQQRIRKEEYSAQRKKYVGIPAMPVLTFLAKRELGNDEGSDQEDVTPDIIDLGIKNPLADPNGEIPVKTSFPFARGYGPGQIPRRDNDVQARWNRLASEASTSGVRYPPTTVATTAMAPGTVVTNMQLETVSDELTKNQKKKQKKKDKKAREMVAAEEVRG